MKPQKQQLVTSGELGGKLVRHRAESPEHRTAQAHSRLRLSSITVAFCRIFSLGLPACCAQQQTSVSLPVRDEMKFTPETLGPCVLRILLSLCRCGIGWFYAGSIAELLGWPRGHKVVLRRHPLISEHLLKCSCRDRNDVSPSVALDCHGLKTRGLWQ